MSLKKNALATVALTGIAVAVSSAYAAGFQLSEQSSLGLGRAFAGAGIVGDDLSAVFYNAAGMTLLPGTQIQAGSVYIDVDAPFTADAGWTNNGRLKGQAIPAGYITHQVNDQLWLGLGMTVPFGMGTDYGEYWQNAGKGNQSMIMTIDINPNVAYKVSEKLSIGAGVSLQYAKAELGQAKIVGQDPRNGSTFGIDSVVNGDSWSWGWNIGLMYQPTETLRFGLAYRSNVCHDAEGDLKISHNIPADLASMNNQLGPVYGVANLISREYDDFKVRVRTPDTIMATATWEATDDLRLSGLVRWAKWSNLGALHIHSSGIQLKNMYMSGNASDIQENKYEWKDTWLFSVGADYRLNNNWTIRGGLAYETGAVDKEELRPATIPDVDRVWFSLGGTYKYNKQIQIDFGATYLMGVGNMDLYSEADDNGQYHKVGEYDSMSSYIIGAQVQYRF